MTIFILHGVEGHAGIHWQQWLHDQLITKGHKVIMPNLPNSNHPDRITWLKTVKKLLRNQNLNNLVIVGHSLAIPTALDFLEQTQKPIKALISIAGFCRNYGDDLNSYFLKEKQINFKKVKSNLKHAFVIYSDNDPYVPQKELKFLANQLSVKPHIIPKAGHINTDTGYTKFPLLLTTIEKAL